MPRGTWKGQCRSVGTQAQGCKQGLPSGLSGVQVRCARAAANTRARNRSVGWGARTSSGGGGGAQLLPVTSGGARGGCGRSQEAGAARGRGRSGGARGAERRAGEGGGGEAPGPRAAAGRGPRNLSASKQLIRFSFKARENGSRVAAAAALRAGGAERRGAAGETALAAVLPAAVGLGPRAPQVRGPSAAPGASAASRRSRWPQGRAASGPGRGGTVVAGPARSSPASLHCGLGSGVLGRRGHRLRPGAARVSRAGRGAHAGSQTVSPLGP